MAFLFDTPGDYLDTPALVSSRATVTYKALNRSAEKVARQLVTLGVGPGDIVAVKGHPTVEVVTALHGIWMAGGIAAPLHPRWTRDEEARGLELLSPRITLLDEGHTVFRQKSEGGAVLTLGSDGRDGLDSLSSHWPDTGPMDSRSAWERKVEPAVRLLTSGTSGRPSVVTLTFLNLAANARAVQERLSLHPSDRWLASLSPAHVGGVAMIIRSALVGSALILTGRFQPRAFHQMVRDGVVTHASLVPTMLRQFMEVQGGEPLPRTLRCLLIGGARAEEDLVRRALDLGFPLALTYGMTEASSQVATAPPELVARKPDTVGSPIPGVEVRLSTEGEIWVSGDTVSPGRRDEKGWYKTGDLGRMDEDGHLFVIGRMSSRIISGGVNVDPAEVEALLRTHPGVMEAAVVGIPDPEWGERVVVAVASRPRATVSLNDLDRLSRAALSPAKRPRGFVLVENLPRNANGKVDREGVRALFR